MKRRSVPSIIGKLSGRGSTLASGTLRVEGAAARHSSGGAIPKKQRPVKSAKDADARLESAKELADSLRGAFVTAAILREFPNTRRSNAKCSGTAKRLSHCRALPFNPYCIMHCGFLRGSKFGKRWGFYALAAPARKTLADPGKSITNSYFLIPNRLIFDSSVCRRILSLVAAP